MRAFQLCVVASMLFATSVASAQVNPSNELHSFGDEVIGEIAVEANNLSSSDLKQLKLDYDLHANSAWSDDNDEIEIADVNPVDEDAIIAKMRHDPRIKFAERQHIFRADGWIPNDPMFDKQWNMKRIGIQTAWAYSNGTGSMIADVDTGVDESISDLQGIKFVAGYNFDGDNENTKDGNSHGTHTVGTMAQATNNQLGVVGEAYGSTILPVKVLSDSGSGSMSSVAEGIRYAADRGAQVISLSLGSSHDDSLTRDAVAYAQSKGSLVVAAAGNSGDTSQHYPSNYPGVVCVSASDENDHLARFSTRGKQIVISSPGTNITQQIPGGEFKAFNGTSMATPGVSGISGMLVSLGLHGNAIKDALTSNADDKNEPTLFGAGILNAGKTLRHVYWSQLLWRTLALFSFAIVLKRKIKSAGGSPVKPGTLGMLLAGTGLLPLMPLVSLLPKLGSFRLLGELAIRPFGCWDTVLLGANVHNWLPFASAIPTILLLITLYHVKSFRSTIGGFSIGTAALLTQLAVQNDGDWSLLYRGLIVGNVALAMWVARVCLDAKLDDNSAPVPSNLN